MNLLSRKRLAILILAFAITRIIPAISMPLVLDESLYSVMIGEQWHAQTLLPTFLGYPVSWKPFLFFSVYSPASALDLLPLEMAYRLPSLIFGLATIPLLLDIFRRCNVSDDISFYSILAYLVSLPSIYPNAAVLADTLVFFLICLSLWLYSGPGGRLRFLPAAAAAFAAFFVKLVVAYIIPVLAIAYYLQYRRKETGDPVFLLSLLSVPLAMALHFAILNGSGLAYELYIGDVGGHAVSAGGLGGQLGLLLDSLGTAVSSGLVLLLIPSAFGFARKWRENLFLSAWYLLGAIPLLSASSIFWYFLPVLPAISYFAVSGLALWKGKERLDRFFMILFWAISLCSLAVAAYDYAALYERAQAEKDAGLLMSGKDDVLILGKYRPGIAAYKILTERREGAERDFGWVLLSSKATVDDALIYAGNYTSDTYPAQQGSFSAFFTKDVVFRKDTNLTMFDYIVVAGSHDESPPGSVIFNRSEISIYSVK